MFIASAENLLQRNSNQFTHFRYEMYREMQFLNVANWELFEWFLFQINFWPKEKSGLKCNFVQTLSLLCGVNSQNYG